MQIKARELSCAIKKVIVDGYDIKTTHNSSFWKSSDGQQRWRQRNCCTKKLDFYFYFKSPEHCGIRNIKKRHTINRIFPKINPSLHLNPLPKSRCSCLLLEDPHMFHPQTKETFREFDELIKGANSMVDPSLGRRS